MNDKKILITGGLGFIGSYIADELIDENEVLIIDNKSTGKVENLQNINHENLTLIEKDLNDADLDDILTDVDYVFHLAAMASVPLSIENPSECIENNMDATIKLINACKNNNVKKIIFSSSSSVYGDNTNIPLKESEYPLPKSPYAASKASGELFLKTYYEAYGLNYISLRYFNVFGPKQDKNSQYAAVIPNFITALLEGEQPIIYGDGEQTRDFIYIRDVVNANIKAAESDYNGIINVASGKKTTINELYKIISETLGSNIEPKYLPERKGDIKHSLADVNNMKKIDYKVNLNDFENQLKETINWFKTKL
ncbi:MAG: NAD-dependent epimerase/dehydratase family protein [Methanobrevibacter sp.]|uniref:NAD-dependent epimerase/dehydratase family protein n=1 Tax=uncultured Methanobrevibacter sp. TaxID=253161 RepID=UPI0025D40BF2|nr:NAD-dependent epimerase/dehydratase family protein [uncultured Methanobrevibacter sp.]MBQ2612527.1 NAD-dependent epimerase/dehydratase family protein [Methanobrevibacter sp.]